MELILLGLRKYFDARYCSSSPYAEREIYNRVNSIIDELN